MVKVLNEITEIIQTRRLIPTASLPTIIIRSLKQKNVTRKYHHNIIILPILISQKHLNNIKH